MQTFPLKLTPGAAGSEGRALQLEITRRTLT